MLNTKYIVLVDDTEELNNIVSELYANETDYEFVCSTISMTPKPTSSSRIFGIWP